MTKLSEEREMDTIVSKRYENRGRDNKPFEWALAISHLQHSAWIEPPIDHFGWSLPDATYTPAAVREDGVIPADTVSVGAQLLVNQEHQAETNVV